MRYFSGLRGLEAALAFLLWAGCSTDAPGPNLRPVAAAGPDQIVQVGEIATLDGSRSYDPDGEPLSFRWELVGIPSGGSPHLSNSGNVQAQLDPDAPGAWIVRLIVSDPSGESDPDVVQIEAAQQGCTSSTDCQSPPAARCDGNDRITYPSPGLCQNGGCVYPAHRETCPQGCQNGVCQGTSCTGVTCDPGESCVDGQCRCGGTGPDCTGATSCCGTQCADLQNDPLNCGTCGHACSAHQVCQGGSCGCQAGWSDCDGQPGCETQGNCPSCPVSCDDHNPCTDDSCDPVAGCQHNPVGNGPDCGSACSGLTWHHRTCQGGTCTDNPQDCDQGINCQIDTCDPTIGCGNAPAPDGTECGSRYCVILIWMKQTCFRGSCLWSEIVENCADRDRCTDDNCNSANGCSHQPVVCGTNAQCRDGSCDCDDQWDDCNEDGNCECHGWCSSHVCHTQ